MIVKMLKPYGMYAAGITVSFPDPIAELLIQRGSAQSLEDVVIPKSVDRPPADKLIRNRSTKERPKWQTN